MPFNPLRRVFLCQKMMIWEIEDEQLDEAFGTIGMHIVDESVPMAPSAEDAVIAQECLGVLYKAIASLPSRQAKIIMLRYGLFGKELTQADVAEVLDVDQSSVSRLEARALEALREIIGADSITFAGAN
jgi:RNA polymerase sigma factor (sigma-70 family)